MESVGGDEKEEEEGKGKKKAEKEQGSVQQSRLSSQFAFQCRNLLQLLNTRKNIPLHLNLRFNLQFKGVHNDKWVSNGHRPPKK